jgi:hypothetical protein
MATIKQQVKRKDIKELKAKAALLDELLELIEEKGLAFFMAATERELNIPLRRAKNLLR